MELLDQFKTYLLNSKDSPNKITVKNYLADVRKFIKWFETRFMRPFTPRLVTEDVVDEFKTQLTSHNSQSQIVSASSLKRYLSSLRKFYQFLISQDIATTNPFEVSSKDQSVPTDVWRVKEFKNFLFLSKASKPTIKNYLMDVRQFITWFENVSPAQTALHGQTTVLPKIDGKLIEEYKNRLLYDARFEARSVNRKLSSLRKYFSWAQEAGIFQNAPQFTQAPREQELAKTPEFSLTDLQQSTDIPEANQPQNSFQYSSFPPLRLMQKIGKGSSFLFDLLIISPVAETAFALKYRFWKLTGKQVFTPLATMVPNEPTTLSGQKTTPSVMMTAVPVTLVDTFITGHNKMPFKEVTNLPKSLYAPLSISTAELTFHKKIIHHMRHTRPRWYRKYHSYRIVHYLHFGVALIYASALGFMIYQAVVESPRLQSPVIASSPGSPPRMLAFEGRLTDDTNTPITAEQNLRFGLYTSQTATGSALLWQEIQSVQPDNNGNFKTLLGKNNPIYQKLLSDNPTLFLGLTIGREEELAPRQQIATTTYSQDSERLQGLLPITQPDAGTANVILALDSGGDLIIGGSASPRFEATGGEFTLAGQILTLATTDGSNGNIQIVPDGSGIVDIQKPIQNTSEYNNLPGVFGAVQFDDSVAIVATSSAQSALYINQNSTGDLISASTSGIARFTVDYAGNGTFSTDLAVNGNNLTTDSPTFNLLNTNVINLNIGQNATNISIASSSGETTINNRLVAQSGITLKSFETGAIPFIGDHNQLTQDKNNFFWASESKRLGLGTNTPLYRLDVRDDQSTGSVAQIYNSSTNPDADGLIVKLGTTTPNTSNNFISFQNGNGTVLGKITGNGGSNVIYNTSGADYAEYYPKANPSENFEQGDIVCITTNNGVSKCDQGQPILGVVSSTAGFVGAGNFENDPNYVLVGIVGQLPVKVSSNSATIASGDALTVGPNGITKATKPGMIVGRALSSFNPATNNMVQVALNIGWYDPTLSINQQGDVLTQEYTQLQDEQTVLDGIIDNIKLGMIEATSLTTQSLSITTENITIGSLTLREYVTAIAKETTRELENQFFTRKLVSPIAEIAHVKTDIISPLAEDAEIALKFEDNQISILNSHLSSQSAVASIDNEGNASFSGTLRAQRIIADQIEGLNIQAATVAANYITNVTNVYNYASQSAEPTVNNQLLTTNNETLGDTTYLDSNEIASDIPNTDFPTFNQGLLALGGSSFTDVGITGTLRIGESMVISNTSINTIGTELAIQPLRQGNISFMGGLVTIDTEGNAVFNKDVTVQGILSTRVLSPVPDSDLILRLGNTNQESGITNQGQNHDSSFIIHDSDSNETLRINQDGNIIASGAAKFEDVAAREFTIIRGAQADTSFTTTVAEGSGGTAVITANERERTIVTPYIKPNSLIYVSPTSPTYGATPYIARQTANSFTIQIPYAVKKDIKLNWWIVN